MSSDTQTPRITPRDRLVTTLCFALLFHGLIVLGIGFTADDPDSGHGTPTLEIVMVDAPTDDPPDKADYLADAAQSGAGNIEERTRARSPRTAVGDPAAQAAERAGESTSAGRFDERRADDTRPEASAVDDPVVTSTRDRPHLRVAVTLRSGAGAARPTAHGMPVVLPSIPADTEAHTALAYSDDPRDRFISVNTDEVLYAAYLHAWRERIERVGNLNYPDEAKRRGLRGALELEVALGANGNVRQLKVRESSGHRVLDDAAMRIVYLASPFPPFDQALRKEVDVLRFAFVWEFGDGVITSNVRAADG